MRLTAAMIVLSLGNSGLLPGQTTPSSGRARVPWGLWATIAPIGTHTAEGKTAAFAFTYQRRQITYSIRLTGAEGPPCTASDCWPDAIDLSVLAGLGTSASSLWQVSAGAGLGVANLRDDDGVGFSGELQASVRPTRVVGFGIYGFGNTVGPQWGVALGIQVGRLR